MSASRWSKGGPKGAPPESRQSASQTVQQQPCHTKLHPKQAAIKQPVVSGVQVARVRNTHRCTLFTVQRPTPKRKPRWSGALLYKGQSAAVIGCERQLTNEKGRAVIGCELQLINEKGHAVIGSERQLTNEKGRAVIGCERQLTNEKGRTVIGCERQLTNEKGRDVSDN